MTFVTISDVHIKQKGDLPSELFIKFLKYAIQKKVKKVYLLGDVFDLLVGGHLLYEKSYPEVFGALKKVIEEGIKITQLEGNHDFHFEPLIKKLLKKWDYDSSVWTYSAEPIVEQNSEKRILFAHGDEIELGNESYKKYRAFIRSSFIKFLANKIVSPYITRAIGQNASKKSRKRNTKRYDEKYEEEKVRPLFRESALQAAIEYNVDIVICGHSHCFDHFEKEGLLYFNNGYLPRTKKFFYFDGENIEAIELDSSK